MLKVEKSCSNNAPSILLCKEEWKVGMNGVKHGGIVAALCFVAGFAIAFPVAWILFTPAAQTDAAGPARVDAISAGEMKEFLRAAESGDFAVMRDHGDGIFREGKTIPNAGSLFARFEANSFPPYSVYAFFTSSDPDMTRRVILTLDDQGKVVSFMAEEMVVDGF